MFGKIHTTSCVCGHSYSGLSCCPSTKQVTRMGMELHLQSNSFQIKKTQVLHLITIAICSSATNSNSARERENIPDLKRLQIVNF